MVYPARDIPPFVMYCVYGESGSSLIIESTDSMISIKEHARKINIADYNFFPPHNYYKII